MPRSSLKRPAQTARQGLRDQHQHKQDAYKEGSERYQARSHAPFGILFDCDRSDRSSDCGKETSDDNDFQEKCHL